MKLQSLDKKVVHYRMAPALSAWIIVSYSPESLIGSYRGQQAAIAQPGLSIEHTNRPCPHVRVA